MKERGFMPFRIYLLSILCCSVSQLTQCIMSVTLTKEGEAVPATVKAFDDKAHSEVSPTYE